MFALAAPLLAPLPVLAQKTGAPPTGSADDLETVLEEAPPEAGPKLEAPYADAEEIELSKKIQKESAPAAPPPAQRPPLRTGAPRNENPDEMKGGRIKKRYIQHPNAKKGLYKITKDGDYLYHIQSSPQKGAASVRFSLFDAPNLFNAETNASFSDIYGGGSPILFFDYEWKLSRWFKGFGNNFSVKLGSGLLVASGNGRLQSTGQESLEKFTFIMLPNHVALAYKLQIWDTQKIIPYAEGGAGYYLFNEYRDDHEPPLGRWGGATVVHAVGGLAFAVTGLDRDSSIRLDADYGINSVWLTAEVRQLVGFGTFDMTSTLFSGGVTVNF